MLSKPKDRTDIDIKHWKVTDTAFIPQSCWPSYCGSNLSRPSKLLHYYTLDEVTMPRNVNKMLIFVRLCACIWGGVHQWPIFSCGWVADSRLSILKRQANCSAWFIFPRLICHFLVRHCQAKCSFHSSVLSLQSCWSGWLTKTWPLATSRKTQKLMRQTFREDYWTNTLVLWNFHWWHTMTQWCLLRLSLLFMSVCMTS